MESSIRWYLFHTNFQTVFTYIYSFERLSVKIVVEQFYLHMLSLTFVCKIVEGLFVRSFVRFVLFALFILYISFFSTLTLTIFLLLSHQTGSALLISNLRVFAFSLAFIFSSFIMYTNGLFIVRLTIICRIFLEVFIMG